MLVHFEQYHHDDAGDAVRSAGDVDPDRDPENYFGTDDLDAEEWERVTEDGEPFLRRSVTLEETVTTVTTNTKPATTTKRSATTGETRTSVPGFGALTGLVGVGLGAYRYLNAER